MKRIKHVERALILSEGNKREASRLTGVSEPTIYKYIIDGWISRELVDNAKDLRAALDKVAEEYRTETVFKARQLADDAIDVASSKIGEATAKDAAIVAGVMIDKAESLEGRPTSYVKHEITGDLEALQRLGIVKMDDAIEAQIVGEDDVVIG